MPTMRLRWLGLAVFVSCACAELAERDTPLSFSLPDVSSAASSSAAPAAAAASSSAGGLSFDLGGASSAAASSAESSAERSAPASSAAPSAAASSPSSGAASSSPASRTSASAAASSAAPSQANSSSVEYPSVTIPVAYSTSVAYNVMSAPSSIATPNATASSNVTYAAAKSTATWSGALPTLISLMYRGSDEAKAHLPTFYWTLANASLESSQLDLICQTQTHFCATAGCEDGDDHVEHNFCDTSKGMATMCTCAKSKSRLPQYQWPVQSQDCLLRLQACRDACNNQKETPFAQRNSCTQACADQIGSSCGKTEQYGANYAVSKPGQTPSYLIVDQSDAQGAGARTAANLALVSAVSLAAAAWLVRA